MEAYVFYQRKRLLSAGLPNILITTVMANAVTDSLGSSLIGSKVSKDARRTWTAAYLASACQMAFANAIHGHRVSIVPT